MSASMFQTLGRVKVPRATLRHECPLVKACDRTPCKHCIRDKRVHTMKGMCHAIAHILRSMANLLDMMVSRS